MDTCLTQRYIVPAEVTDHITTLTRERLWAEPWEAGAGGQACGQGDGHGGQNQGERG